MYRNHIFTAIALSFAGIFFLSSCSKSGSTETITKSQLLTTKPWRYNQVGIDQNADGVIDYPLPTAILPVCEVDNMFTFKKDSTGVMDEGKELCTTTSKQTTAFTWKLLNNDTELSSSVTILPYSEGAVKVIVLNETTLTLSKNISLYGFPTPLTVISNLVH